MPVVFTQSGRGRLPAAGSDFMSQPHIDNQTYVEFVSIHFVLTTADVFGAHHRQAEVGRELVVLPLDIGFALSDLQVRSFDFRLLR